MRDFYQKTQEIKLKIKTRLVMLNHHHHHQQQQILSNQEKLNGKCKQYVENLYNRDKKMTDTFEEDSYEGGPVILESKVKAVPKVLGRNKS